MKFIIGFIGATFLISGSIWAQNIVGRGAPAKVLFSEDFESGKIDPTLWEKRVTGAVELKVVQDPSAHGKYALLVHYPADARACRRALRTRDPSWDSWSRRIYRKQCARTCSAALT